MPVVNHKLNRPGGVAMADEIIHIRLLASSAGEGEGFVATTQTGILSEYKLRTDSTGTWTITLTANTLITPANTTYQVIQPGTNGAKVTETFVVPNGAGPYWLGDILADPPAGLPGTALAAHDISATAHAGLRPRQSFTLADAKLAEEERNKRHGVGHAVEIPVGSYSSTVGFSGANVTSAGASLISTFVQNDEVTYKVPLTAGFYTLRMLHGVGTNRGIYRVRVNGVLAGEIDGYASAAQTALGELAGLFVAQDGIATLNLKMEVKNAASSSYFAAIVELSLVGQTVRALSSTAALGSIVAGNVGGLITTNDAAWKVRQVREIGNVVYDPAETVADRAWKFTYSGVNALNTVAVGIAFSPDGEHWTESPVNPIIALGEDPYIAINPDGTAYRDAQNRLHLFCEQKEAGFINSQGGIDHYTSTDGVVWTADAANPVIVPPGGTAWDATDRTSPVVVWDGSQFVMLFEGRSFGGSVPPGSENYGSIGVCRSPNGTNWTMSAANPIITRLVGTQWNEGSIVADDIRLIGSTWVLIVHGGHLNVFNIGRYKTAVAPGAWDAASFVEMTGNPYSVESSTDMYHGADGLRVVRRPGTIGSGPTYNVRNAFIYAL